MKRVDVLPLQLDFATPGRRDYWVLLEHDSIWGTYRIPLTVWVGPKAQSGKGVVALGSTHGNEYEGPTALKNLLSKIKLADVTGRIIFVPVLNVEAFQTGTRDSVGADGVNLNRAFVADAGKTPPLSGITHRIAAFVRDYLWPQAHVVLDLHSGGDVLRFQLCASFHLVDEPEQSRLIEDTARWFGTPLLMVYQNRTSGLLTSEAERLGKITVGTELGWGRAVNADGVRYATQGVLAACIHHGQMTGEIVPIASHAAGTQIKATVIDHECYVPAPFPGHYEEMLACGTQVNKGDIVGWLHDFNRIDESPYPVQAGVSGIVVGQAWGAVVRPGQHILVVGQIVD